MHKNGRLDDHQKFRELSALAQGGECSDSEWLELKRHLQTCASCRDAYHEYSLIAKEGMPFLAVARGRAAESTSWDEGAAWRGLLRRIRAAGPSRPALVDSIPAPIRTSRLPWSGGQQWTSIAAVALLIVAVSIGAYRLGSLARPTGGMAENLSSSSAHLRELNSEKKAADETLASQTAQMSRLQKQISSEQQELTKLHAAWRAAEDQSGKLSSGIDVREEQVRQLAEQRDRLATQLRETEQIA